MDALYRRAQGKTWILFEGTAMDRGSIEMIRRNRISGLGAFYEEWEDSHWYYGYEITGAQALPLVLSFEALNAESLRNLLGQIAKMIRNLEQYLLLPEGILLNPELIYFDMKTRKCRFFYCSSQEGELADHMKELAWFLLGKISVKDREALEVLFRFCRAIEESGPDSERLCEVMEQLGSGWEEPEKFEEEAAIEESSGRNYENEDDTSIIGARKEKSVCKKIRCWIEILMHKQPKQQEEIENWIPYRMEEIKENEENRNLSENTKAQKEQTELTELLYADETDGRPVLICEEDRERILLEEFPFFNGSQEGTQLNPRQRGISRLHAKINQEEGSYFITDLNSTNGTNLNGEALAPYERTGLQAGDRIMLAKTSYRFCLFDMADDS